MTELNVFTYDDYRKFLADYYGEQKSQYPQKFSYRYFNRQLGLKSFNFIYLVIKGERNLRLETTQKLSAVLGLKGRASQYFTNLVQFNQTKDTRDKELFFDKLTSFKEYRDTRFVEDSQRIYFSRWYYPVVREMVKMKSFRPDPRWVARHIQPPIHICDAEDALHVLKQLHLVEIMEDGTWVQIHPQLKSRDKEINHDIAMYHKKMIGLGYESLGRPKVSRDVTGLTMSLSRAKFRIIRKKIQGFQEEIQDIVRRSLTETFYKELGGEEKSLQKDELETSLVCQLNIQFFQLAHGGNKNEDM